MRAYLDSARAAFPDLPFDESAFCTHVERHQATTAPDHAGDLLLAFASGAGDPRALSELERLYFRELAAPGGALARFRHQVAPDEVVQNLRTRLLVGGEGGAPPRILDYAGRGPLGGWLRVAAIRTALNMVRDQARAEPVADADALVDAASPLDAELEHLRQRHASDFRAAFEDALRGLTAEERTLLRFHAVDGLTVDEIGVVYNIHRATAARRVQRAREQVEARTRSALAERLRVSATELDSLVAVLRSQLDVTIGRLLSAVKDE